MECETCEQLTAELSLLETRYATAREHLNDMSATAVADRYNRARMQADDARLDCEVARLKLERHQLTHSA